MRKVKSVDIVLENCEVYNFNANDVNVQLRGLGRDVWGVDDFLIAKEAHIQIKKNELTAEINAQADADSRPNSSYAYATYY